MDVPPNLVVFLPDDEADLAVRLQLFHAVDDVHAGVFQALRPLDVAALVESRLQLDEHRHLLAALGRLDEPIDDGRVGADAVERHLDGDDARIVDRRVDERFDRLERVERMMHQLIAVADLVEDVGRSLPPHLGWLQRPIPQIRARDRGERRPVREPHAAAGPDDDVAAGLEVLDQEIEHARRHGVIDFEKRDRAVPLLAQPAIDDFQYGLGGVARMGDGHFHVADDAEHVRGADAHAGKQLPEVLANHVFEHREPAHAVSAREARRSAAAGRAP